MRLYELMVIFHPGQEAEAVKASVDRIGSVVTERGGSVPRVDVWGRRRFAYEVKHVKDGTYVVAEILSDPETVTELDRVLSITDEVLRHKIVRLPDAGIPAVVPGIYEEQPERREPRSRREEDDR